MAPTKKESPLATALAVAEKPAPMIPITAHLAQWEKIKALKNDAQFHDCDNALGDIKGIIGKIEAERKELTGPLHEVKTKLDKRARLIRAPFEKLEEHVKSLLAAWHDVQMVKQVKEAEKEAAAIAKQSPQAAAEVLALATRANATPAANASFSTRVYGLVTDKTKLPLEYMEPNQKKIDAVIKAGGSIPGVERKEDTKVAGSAAREYNEVE